MKQNTLLILYSLGIIIVLLFPAACGVQFKSAPINDNSLKIRGHVYKPAGEGPFPAVIIMHGCSGMDDHHTNWAQIFVSWGYAAFPIDSFGARGVANVCDKVWKVSYDDRGQDALGAAKFLQDLPYIDADKIGVIGFSHGAKSAIAATKKNLLKYIAKMDYSPIKAAVAFYPWCDPYLDANIAIPTLILIGEKDDWTPANNCVSLPRVAENPGMIDVVVYDGAYHSFDRDKRSRDYAGHRLEYHRLAAQKAKKQTREFFDKYLKNAH